MQNSRVIMDNRSALRWEWFGKVLQFGLENTIQPSSFFSCLPPLGPELGEKCGVPQAALRSVPTVARCHTCRSSLWPWIVEVLFAGNVSAKCCSSAWMRSSPASPLLAFPPLGPGLGEKCACPRPHVAASAHCRRLEVCSRSDPKVAGRHKCRSAVRPWAIELLFV
jgi:hypothetical protein